MIYVDTIWNDWPSTQKFLDIDSALHYARIMMDEYKATMAHIRFDSK